MLHKANRVGPVNMIDPDVSIVSETTTAIVSTAIGTSAVNVYLDTVNLGTQEEGFVHYHYGKVGTLSTVEQTAFGLCLLPMENVTNDAQDDDPIYVEYFVVASWNEANGVIAQPFVGYIDTAGIALGS